MYPVQTFSKEWKKILRCQTQKKNALCQLKKMSLLKKATIGAGIGATAGITFHIIQQQQSASKTNGHSQQQIKYKYIENHSEIRFHIGEIISMQTSETETIIDAVQDSMDRLLAIEVLSETSTKETVRPSWPITAQHYVQDITDGIILFRSKISLQQQTPLDVHWEEIKTVLNNIVYNVDMQVQNLLN